LKFLRKNELKANVNLGFGGQLCIR
jgi:hypothetical protein